MKIDEILNLANKFAESVEVRPQVFYKNYDYGTQSKSEKENTKLGPGTGFFSNMDNFKSIKDFINSDRKMKRKQRKKKLAFLCLAEDKKTENLIEKLEDDKDLSDIPDDVLHSGETKEEVLQDNTINGIPFTNKVDQFPTYDSSIAAPVGYMFDNDIMHNSYEGLFSMMGSEINKALKLAEYYYDLVQKG